MLRVGDRRRPYIKAICEIVSASPYGQDVFDYTVTCTECGASWWMRDERGPDELDTVECLACGATTQDVRARGGKHFEP